MTLKKQNNKESKKDFALKVFNWIYLISIYSLLLNSVWYFIRLFVFDRRIDVSLVEIDHFFLFIFFVISVIALFRYHISKSKNRTIQIMLRLIFIVFVYFSVSLTLYHTYFRISPYVQPYWDSGEWTF